MLLAQPRTEPGEGGLSLPGPLVLHLEDPWPEDPRVPRRRAAFRSLVEALGLELLSDDEPAEVEANGLYYSCYVVTDAVEWADLFDPEDGTLFAHYAIYKGQDAAEQGVSDLTRGVLQAAVAAAADVDEKEAGALIASLEEQAESGKLAGITHLEDGRTAVLRTDGETWTVLVSCGD